MYQFAIIGCGRIAARHAEQIGRIGKLVAVCDTVKEKADLLAATCGARAYYNLDELLKEEKEVEVISVCTPNGFHAEHAIKSLQAGRHVLCEKPLCLTSAAAWQIIETEKFSRRKLFVVKSTRYNPLLQDLKRLIEEGGLGRVYSFALNCCWNRPGEYYTDWRGKAFPDGGTLYTQFSHYLDAVLWLFGDLEEARGFRTNAAHLQAIEFEDTGVAALRMQSGLLGALHWSVNAYRKNQEISLTVVAEKGTLRIGGEYGHRVEYQELEKPFIFRTPFSGANDYGTYKGSMSNHREVYDHLLASLQGNGQSGITNAFDGLKTVEAIEKIYKSITEI